MPKVLVILCKLYSGGLIRIPLPNDLRRIWRDARLMNLFRRGMSAREIAQEFGLTARFVEKIINNPASTITVIPAQYKAFCDALGIEDTLTLCETLGGQIHRIPAYESLVEVAAKAVLKSDNKRG